MKVTLEERGVMLSDYFSGTPGVMIPITIDRKTTCQEVLEMLKDEINMIWDHIHYTALYHKCTDDVWEPAVKTELLCMQEYITVNKKWNVPYNSDLEYAFDEMDDDELDLFEGSVAIFTIEFERED